MIFIPSAEQLRGTSYDKAHLYGMPHLGAHYSADDVNCTAWNDEVRKCAVCGRTAGFHSKHHEPPKGRSSSYTMQTPWGAFVLKPALIDLCGTGTTGCHSKRHNGLIRFRWEWDTYEFSKMWWDGTFLKNFPPNGQWLFAYGYYVVELMKDNKWVKSHEIRGWDVEE